MILSNALSYPDLGGEITPEKLDTFLTMLFLEYAKRSTEVTGSPKANLETRYVIHCIYENNVSTKKELCDLWDAIRRTSAKEKFKELGDKWLWNEIGSWMNKFESILHEPLIFE